MKKRVHQESFQFQGDPPLVVRVLLEPAKMLRWIRKARDSSRGTTTLGGGSVTIEAVCNACGEAPMKHDGRSKCPVRFAR